MPASCSSYQHIWYSLSHLFIPMFMQLMLGSGGGDPSPYRARERTSWSPSSYSSPSYSYSSSSYNYGISSYTPAASNYRLRSSADRDVLLICNTLWAFTTLALPNSYRYTYASEIFKKVSQLLAGRCGKGSRIVINGK